jgi:hypothetical protein
MSKEDKDFAYWIDFFDRKKPSLAEFYVALRTKDSYFLNHDAQASFDDVLYEKVYQGGFMEGDIRKIMRGEDKDGYYKTRFALFLELGLPLNDLKKVMSEEVLEEMIGDILVNGNYQECGVEFANLMTAMFKGDVCKIDGMLEWGFLYGTKMGEKYGETYPNTPELLKAIDDFKGEVKVIEKDGIAEPKVVQSLGYVEEIDEDDWKLE